VPLHQPSTSQRVGGFPEVAVILLMLRWQYNCCLVLPYHCEPASGTFLRATTGTYMMSVSHIIMLGACAARRDLLSNSTNWHKREE
jgi:hypothetical protein